MKQEDALFSIILFQW